MPPILLSKNLNYAFKEKDAILSTLFNQKSDFNVNTNFYQTQIDSFIL